MTYNFMYHEFSITIWKGYAVRLRDYQKLLAENIPLLEFEASAVLNNDRLRKLTNYVKAMKAVQAFEKNNLFIDLISLIKQYPDVYNNNYEPYIVNETIASKIYNTLESIVKNAKILKNTIDNILSKENENFIYFKLPQYRNIEELSEFFNNLKLILNVFRYLGCEPEFKGFDVGSEYVLFCFSALPLLMLLYQIADKSLTLRNKKLEGDKTIADIEKLRSQKNNMDIDSINKIIQCLKISNENEYNKLRESLINEMISISDLKLDRKDKNEFKNLLSIALEKSGQLIEKGMKLIPALCTTNEILQITEELNKNIQAYEKAYIGINEMRLLTENTSSSEEKNKN